MKAPFLLFLYGVALFFVLKNYYKTGKGLPPPRVIAAPSYLYGILSLVSGFTGGLTIPIAAGLTVALIWQTQNASAKATPNGGAQYVGPSPPSTTKLGAGPGMSLAGK